MWDLDVIFFLIHNVFLFGDAAASLSPGDFEHSHV